jgi:hypothetical protein
VLRHQGSELDIRPSFVLRRQNPLELFSVQFRFRTENVTDNGLIWTFKVIGVSKVTVASDGQDPETLGRRQIAQRQPQLLVVGFLSISASRVTTSIFLHVSVRPRGSFEKVVIMAGCIPLVGGEMRV